MRLPFIDGFMLAMLGAIALALLAPQYGLDSGPLHLDAITTWGVALVFFLSGIGLSPAKLRAGAANWRLHLFVQLSCFALFPLIGLVAVLSLAKVLPRDLLIGFFYLCVLPSTVSTSIAMTALARGNLAGAIFNATLSSLLGIVLTPLFISLWLQTAGGEVSPLAQLGKLTQQLLLPFALGQLLRPLIGDRLARYKSITTKIDRSVIVLIVYHSFCEATAAGVWTRYGAQPLLLTIVLTGALLVLVLTTTRSAARALRFNTEDEIAAVFCGSKKSLAVGAPMAALIFGASGGALGLIMLPLIVYHQLQLVVCSTIAQRYAARSSDKN